MSKISIVFLVLCFLSCDAKLSVNKKTSTLKNKVEIRLSHNWRRDWRELGDYASYPDLMSYVNKVCLPKEYGPNVTLIEAANIFFNDNIAPRLKPFDMNGKWPLPSKVLNEEFKYSPIL